jgi:glucosamine--fructose-6-phosphate aminotransferase (isomerizing)
VSLWDEINEQPAVLERLLRAEATNVARLAAAFRTRGVQYVVIAARGSSDNAARYAQYLWGARNRIQVALAAPSLFAPNGSSPSLDGALVVAISQSGESPDLVSVLVEARNQGRPTIAITNAPDSPVAATSDQILTLNAGDERAIPATKTYTAELLAVAMLSVEMAQDAEMRSSLTSLPDQVRLMLERSTRIQQLAAELRDIDRAAVLGRGFHLSTAFEWALKLQETAEVLALPFSTADFEHGPIAIVSPGFPVFAVVPPGPLSEDMERLLLRLREESERRLLLVTGSPGEIGHGDLEIKLPSGVPAWAAPIPAIVAGQLFCRHLAVAKGLDPDAPRHLRKVTRTR